MSEILAILMFCVTFLLIFSGYPVAFVLSGSALLFFCIGTIGDFFPFSIIEFMPNRIYSIMSNNLLLAIPYFIFMGNILRKTKLAEDLLLSMGKLFGNTRGGVGVAVIIVGTLLAASTSIVAASVVTMGLISLPVMLDQGYSKQYSTGIIIAAGTLGQMIPPSIVLIALSDQLNVSVGDLFQSALIPGLILAGGYIIYTLALGKIRPEHLPQLPKNDYRSSSSSKLIDLVLTSIFPPLALIVIVLGSIFLGVATPTEAGALGAIGAIGIASMKKTVNIYTIYEASKETIKTVAMVMFLLIGSTFFVLIFRGFNGDQLFMNFLTSLPGGQVGFILVVSIVIFILGFFIDFFEIIFIVVPLIEPSALALNIDLVWLGIIICLNIQTSFLTPPFGFSLFFLRSVAPSEVRTVDIFKGVIPFIIIQLATLIVVYFFPQIIK
ncbi:TRAP transporter large permease subunit [Reichenbachiella sp.]|uniref:TRAP transporter large permease n=1 Tax=Reichenbachiella sp. TaxID=2184521 RepID=UPI0032998FCF